jgi:hypothetical protein
LVRRDYRKYVQSITEEVQTNPKRFYSLINSRKKLSRISHEVERNDNSASADDGAELFNTFFKSNFSTENFELPMNYQVPLVTPISLCNNYCSYNDVYSISNNISESRGAGADGIPAIFVKIH